MAAVPDIRLSPEEPNADTSVLRVRRPSTLVIFGATGDLTARKLVPALFNLHLQGLLPERIEIIGAARRDLSDDAFRDAMSTAVARHSRTQPVPADRWSDVARRLHYQRVRFDESDDYRGLAERLAQVEGGAAERPQRLFYLATDPVFFLPILRGLARAGLTGDRASAESVRVVVEKPFGRDLPSAKELLRDTADLLEEEQVYRIDHYLGKETVQNILSFRFGNSIFEPLFNGKYVQSVQITAAETIGMEGRRGAYYDAAGALRDVVQNHVLQLLCLVAMEPPAVLGPKEIRDEKVKVLRSLRPLTDPAVRTDVVRGQYVAGVVDGEAVPGYRQEQSVDPRSQTETFVAMRMAIDNWRWAGVPFFVRAGKRLARRTTEIAVQFKEPPLHFFTTVECLGDVCDISRAKPNVLVFRIQPNEGISLVFSAKRPGMRLQIHPVEMDFIYNRAFPVALPEAYERLLLDALRGDSTLFTRGDEVEAAWGFVDPILKAWASGTPPPLAFYEAGTWGPREADALFHPHEGAWRNG